MRGLVIAALVVVVGTFATMVMERWMSDAPDWIWRWIHFGVVIGALTIALLSNPLYDRLTHFRMYPASSTATVAMSAALIAAAIWVFLVIRLPSSKIAEPPSKPQTVYELFQNDFPALLKSDSETEFIDGKTNTKTKIKFRVYLDFEGKSKFVSFYVPFTPSTFDACRLMVDAFQGFLDEADKVKIGAGVPGTSERAWSKDLVFTGKFFVYHESDLTLEEQGDLSALYKSKGFLVQFRGQSYVTTRFLQSRAK